MGAPTLTCSVDVLVQVIKGFKCMKETIPRKPDGYDTNTQFVLSGEMSGTSLSAFLLA